LRARGYTVCNSPAGIPADAGRVVALFDSPEVDMVAVVRQATRILARNRNGFFLMVEVDMHTDHVKTGLDHALLMDRVLRDTAGQLKDDTLIVFSADHSFDLRVRAGRKDEPLLPPGAEAEASGRNVRMNDSHTGEEVLVAAQGPGSERVHGFFSNTDLFHIMMRAFGWE
jgi:alkaline phosphatase